MRFAAIVFALLYASIASAETWSSTTTVRLGSKVISAGDSEKRVLDAGGEPTVRRTVTGEGGVKLAEEWLYSAGPGSYIVIRINNSRTVLDVHSFTDR